MLCDPGSELRLGGRENRRAKIMNMMGEKLKKKKRLVFDLNDGKLFPANFHAVLQSQTVK